MQTFNTSYKSNNTILALGAESAGNFSVFNDNKIYYSSDFNDLQRENNYNNYINSISLLLKKLNLKPDIVITDLHPLLVTTELGIELSKKYNTKHIQVQHHLAHIFSAVGEHIVLNNKKLPNNFIGIACDGTGFGFDEKIWGGEIFKINLKNKTQQRIAHLENQTLLGGELAILEPARMLFSILNKILDKHSLYSYIKQYYSKNEFEILYNQLNADFNCLETSSTGRVLDAVSLLLGFSKNNITHKHEPIELLEKNSSTPHSITPKIYHDKKKNISIIQTTPLFKYLINNLQDNKHELAATAQLYIAQGIYEVSKSKNKTIFMSGGISNNKIISTYLEKRNVIGNKKLANGDNAISFGQLFYYLYMNETV